MPEPPQDRQAHHPGHSTRSSCPGVRYRPPTSIPTWPLGPAAVRGAGCRSVPGYRHRQTSVVTDRIVGSPGAASCWRAAANWSRHHRHDGQLKLLLFSGIQVSVIGRVRTPTIAWFKASAVGHPVVALNFGYTNSWTPRSIWCASIFARLIAYMDPTGTPPSRRSSTTRHRQEADAGLLGGLHPAFGQLFPSRRQRTLDGGDERSRRPGAAAARARWTMPPSGSLPRRARWPPPEPPG